MIDWLQYLSTWKWFVIRQASVYRKDTLVFYYWIYRSSCSYVKWIPNLVWKKVINYIHSSKYGTQDGIVPHLSHIEEIGKSHGNLMSCIAAKHEHHNSQMNTYEQLSWENPCKPMNFSFEQIKSCHTGMPNLFPCNPIDQVTRVFRYLHISYDIHINMRSIFYQFTEQNSNLFLFSSSSFSKCTLNPIICLCNVNICFMWFDLES